MAKRKSTKVQKDKQHTHKTKDRVTQTPLKLHGWTKLIPDKWSSLIYQSTIISHFDFDKMRFYWEIHVWTCLWNWCLLFVLIHPRIKIKDCFRQKKTCLPPILKKYSKSKRAITPSNTVWSKCCNDMRFSIQL